MPKKSRASVQIPAPAAGARATVARSAGSTILASCFCYGKQWRVRGARDDLDGCIEETECDHAFQWRQHASALAAWQALQRGVGLRDAPHWRALRWRTRLTRDVGEVPVLAPGVIRLRVHRCRRSNSSTIRLLLLHPHRVGIQRQAHPLSAQFVCIASSVAASAAAALAAAARSGCSKGMYAPIARPCRSIISGPSVLSKAKVTHPPRNSARSFAHSRAPLPRTGYTPTESGLFADLLADGMCTVR